MFCSCSQKLYLSSLKFQLIAFIRILQNIRRLYGSPNFSLNYFSYSLNILYFYQKDFCWSPLPQLSSFLSSSAASWQLFSSTVRGYHLKNFLKKYFEVSNLKVSIEEITIQQSHIYPFERFEAHFIAFLLFGSVG